MKNVYTFEYQKLFLKKPIGFLNIFIDFINLYRLDRLYYKIATSIDNGHYDIAFINPSFYDYVHCPGLLRYLDTKSVYYCHEPVRGFYEPDLFIKTYASFKMRLCGLFFAPVYKLYEFCFKIYDLYNIRQSDLTLCNSYYSKGYIYKAYGVSAQVNYLGVDTWKFKPLGITKENLALSIGHLEPKKGHDFIIRAVAKLPESIRPKLIIVYPIGSEANRQYREYLKDLAEDHKVEVSFLERITDDDLVILYNQAKLTLCAYVREPFGLVPLESMACQTPVVAIKEAGLNESVINNQTGILTERDIYEFSQAMEYLLKNEEIRIKLGEFGRKYVLENWTREKATEEIEKNFLSVIKNE